MNRLWELIERNRFAVAGITVGLALALGGCFLTPKVESPTSGKMVTGGQLQAEIQGLIIQYDAAIEELNLKNEQYAAITNFVTSTVMPAFGPTGIAAGAAVAGLGLFGDNRRKDRVIDRKRQQIKDS